MQNNSRLIFIFEPQKQWGAKAVSALVFTRFTFIS